MLVLSKKAKCRQMHLPLILLNDKINSLFCSLILTIHFKTMYLFTQFISVSISTVTTVPIYLVCM